MSYCHPDCRTIQIRALRGSAVPACPPGRRDAEDAVDARLARQPILNDPERRFGWVITEAALWWRAAEWAVQAEALLEGIAIRFATR